MIQLVTATEAHARALQLRESDIRELRHTDPDRDLEDVLLRSLEVTEVRLAAVTDSGEVLAIGGLALTADDACPWMLCSENIKRHGTYVMKAGALLIEDFKRIAGDRMLNNWIAKDNHSARRFITALGFRIVPAPTGQFDFFYLPPNV